MNKVHGSQSMTTVEIERVFGLTIAQRGLLPQDDQGFINWAVEILNHIHGSEREKFLEPYHHNFSHFFPLSPKNKAILLLMNLKTNHRPDFKFFCQATDIFPLTEENPLTNRLFNLLFKRRDLEFHTHVVGLFLPTMTPSQKIDILTSLESLRDHELSDTLYNLMEQVQDMTDPEARVSIIQAGCTPKEWSGGKSNPLEVSLFYGGWGDW